LWALGEQVGICAPAAGHGHANLPAHSALLTFVRQCILAPGSVRLVAIEKEEEKGRRGIGILWRVARSVRRHNLQIPFSNPFLHTPMRAHICIGHPCSVAVWAQACSLQQLVAQSHTTKISLWLPTTNHLLTIHPKISLRLPTTPIILFIHPSRDCCGCRPPIIFASPPTTRLAPTLIVTNLPANCRPQEKQNTTCIRNARNPDQQGKRTG
jgi:hypothetical protein